MPMLCPSDYEYVAFSQMGLDGRSNPFLISLFVQAISPHPHTLMIHLKILNP